MLSRNECIVLKPREVGAPDHEEKVGDQRLQRGRDEVKVRCGNNCGDLQIGPVGWDQFLAQLFFWRLAFAKTHERVERSDVCDGEKRLDKEQLLG